VQKKIVLLGSTGSIGKQTLEVVAEHPERFEIAALAAGLNVELLAQQIHTYRPKYVSVASTDAARGLRSMMPAGKTEILTGIEGLTALAGMNGIDIVVVAVTGIHGLYPTLAALENKTPVALANKETLVAGGFFVMKKAKEMQTPILPVDSEHAAIFQCLEPENHAQIDKLILTASGGPFINYSKEELENVTPEKALRHPNWQMGKKITIDSAGLINKGLEVIEAHWLFDIEFADIEVVVHPQSIIHSMVQYKDGSVIAQMGRPDMRVPIQYALTYPSRLRNSFPKLDFTALESLTFARPDFPKFPGLKLAYQAGIAGGSMPTVYNAANEVAVELFMQGRLGFRQIPALIEKVMLKHDYIEVNTIGEIIQIDQWARMMAYSHSKS
jgi:1-deoxy-D-xylulose-5-phosphate reductoisomerase